MFNNCSYETIYKVTVSELICCAENVALHHTEHVFSGMCGISSRGHCLSPSFPPSLPLSFYPIPLFSAPPLSILSLPSFPQYSFCWGLEYV